MDKEKQMAVKEPCPCLKEGEDQEENPTGFYCMAGGNVRDIMEHSKDIDCARRCFYDKVPREQQ